MSVFDNGASLLAALTPPKPQLFELPNGAGEVYIRRLDAATVEAYQSSVLVRDGDGYVVDLNKISRAKLVCLGVCDKDGRRLFDDSDCDAISKMDGVLVAAIHDAIAVLNGLDAGARKAAEKNSGTIRG